VAGSAGRVEEVCVGAVVPRTGRLATLGDPLSFVLEWLGPALARPAGDGPRIRTAWRDNRSAPADARRAVEELVREDGAHVVVTMAGTKVLPAVADTCEELGVPCVSTTFPWQAFVYGRGGGPEHPFRFTYHFAWGLDDIAGVFAGLWERLGPARTVGCLWNDDLQGRLLRDPGHGFAPVARARGHTLVDPGGYREPATGFEAHIDRFLEAGTEIVTSAATVADLTLFHTQARARGLRPRLLTCSRWLAYPRGSAGALDDAHIATLVYWSPRHPYRSSLDGTTAAGLADAYRRRTGNRWLQPLGPAHALIEVAAHALATAEDPADRLSVADALGRTRLETITGTLDFTAGPTPNVARVPLAGGQWQPGADHTHELVVVSRPGLPALPVDADLILAG
jgi:branched-chain amino acid transport system substrate-binding protein